MMVAAPPLSLLGGLRARLRPEAALILCGARLELRAGDREQLLRLLDTKLDWAYLLNLASRHGLRPLLYRHLNAIAAAAVPKAVFAQLWSWHEFTARRNQAMAKELLRILGLLDTNGIPAVPYKGPALAASIYGDLTLREFGDLDILLKPNDAIRAKDILQAEGYLPDLFLPPAVEAGFVRSKKHYDIELLHEQTGVLVELHWKTNSEFAIEATGDERWWNALVTAELCGTRVRSLAPEELLLILCLHGVKHRWRRLGWLVDVAELVRQHPRMDWARVLAIAKARGCKRRLAVGLHLAHHLLDMALPQDVMYAISVQPRSTALACAIGDALFQEEFPQLDPLQELRFDLTLYDRRTQQFRHCVEMLLAPSYYDWSQRTLPRALAFVYLPRRLIRLAKKYVPMALGRR